jgi:hypothetical protein
LKESKNNEKTESKAVANEASQKKSSGISLPAVAQLEVDNSSKLDAESLQNLDKIDKSTTDKRMKSIPNYGSHNTEKRTPEDLESLNAVDKSATDKRMSAAKSEYRMEKFTEAASEKEKPESRLDQAADFGEKFTATPANLLGGDGVSGMGDAFSKKLVTTDSGGDKKAAEAAGTAQAGTNMGYVTDGFGILGLVNLAKALKDSGDPEKDGWEQGEAFAKYIQGGMNVGESVTKTTKNIRTEHLDHYEKSNQESFDTALGSSFEGYGNAFAAIASAFSLMKKIIDTKEEAADLSTAEKVTAAVQASGKLLETAKSVVLSVKSFIEMVEGAASGSLMSAIPGLDIAIAAGKIIIDGYYLKKSLHEKNLMEERRNAIAIEKGKKIAELDQASEDYRKRDAKVANKQEVINETDERLGKVEEMKRWGGTRAATRDQKNAETAKLKARRTELLKEMEEEKEKVSATNISVEDVAEFSMVTELRDANHKRVMRQSVHIIAEAAKIAGAVATLTGVGAVGGAAVKGAAAAMDASLPAARYAKQKARDRAARKEAKGKSGELGSMTSVTDTSKSTAAKAAHRKQKATHLFKMIETLSDKDPQDKSHIAEITKVKGYIEAAGVNHNKLIKEKDPKKCFAMIYEAFNKREMED